MIPLRYLTFKIIIIFLLSILYTKSFAKDRLIIAGPPIFCKHIKGTKESIDLYKEEDLIILMQTNASGLYFIIYRNVNTGSWSLIGYNLPHPSIPKDKSCLMLGGSSSLIISNLDDLEKIINKQNEGLDKFTVDNTLKKEM